MAEENKTQDEPDVSTLTPSKVHPALKEKLEARQSINRGDVLPNDVIFEERVNFPSGDGGYMVIVQVEDLEHEKARLAGTDIRVVYNIDTERAKAVHLHPKDVPGAIASLDMMDPPEAWYWAGTDWGQRIATNVGNIIGAEIQSDDPQDTADRWALAFGRELGSSSGMPILSYDTSEVRFVKATDGRGAGLRAIDIEVKDTDALFLAAERHGLEFSDSKVTVCGTDINLV